MSSTILDNIIWFRSCRQIAIEEMILDGVKRHIDYHLPSKHSRGKSGSFYSNKNGYEVFYESQLEFKLFALLESSSRVYRYQSQPLRIKYGDAKKYYPDAIFYFQDGTGVICEVKPIKEMGLESNWKKWKALKEFCKLEGYGLLITDGETTFSDLTNHKLNEEYVTQMLEVIEQKKHIEWSDYYDIKNTYDANWRDLVSFIIQNKLTYTHDSRFRIVDKNRSLRIWQAAANSVSDRENST